MLTNPHSYSRGAMRRGAPLAALCMGTLLAAAAHAAVPAYIAAAVADSGRPATDTQRDALRKPGEVLSFAGVKPGDAVGELMPGRGYFTRLFCKAVGDKGHVYTVNITPTMPMRGPPPPDMPRGDGPPPGAGGPAPGAGGPPPGAGGPPPGAGGPPPGGPPAPQAPPCPNVSSSSMKAADFALAGPLDIFWTSENYHDLHGGMFGTPDMKTFNRVIYAALKPGGVYMVEDHAAAPGSGARDAGTLHRIDPQTVIAEVTAAGFVLDGRSDVLANPADTHTEAVFGMNGRSDKFLLKFRRPAGK